MQARSPAANPADLDAGSAPGNSTAEFQRLFAGTGWEATRHAHQSFGSGTETVWLRFAIDFHPRASDNENADLAPGAYHLVQQYAWIDSLTLLHQTPDGLVRRIKSGDMIPFAERRPPHRLPVFAVELRPGLNRFLLRVKSRSEKFLALKLRPAGETDPQDLAWVVVVATAGLASFVSLLIAVVLRERLAWFYITYALSLSIVLLVWEGYGHSLLYPQNPEYNDPLVQGLLCVFLFCLLEFWRRLLILSLLSPLLDRMMRLLGATLLGSIALVLVPGESHAIWDLVTNAGVLGTMLLLLYSGWLAIRRGFSPAYWSMIGVGLFMAAMTVFNFAGIGDFPGNDYTRLAPYFAFFFEFSLFLASMVIRMRFLSQIAAESARDPGGETQAKTATTPVPVSSQTHEDTAAGERSHIDAPRKAMQTTRLPRSDIRELCRRLTRLLEQERLFADEDLSQERLGGLLELSRHQMSELFQLTYASSYYDAVNRLRINEARRLLVDESERTVLSIALAVGYASKSSFNTEFRKRCGVSPTEFRQSARE